MGLVMRVGRRLSSKIDNPRKERTNSSKTGKEFSPCFGDIVDSNTGRDCAPSRPVVLQTGGPVAKAVKTFAGVGKTGFSACDLLFYIRSTVFMAGSGASR
jgi:hypothetical protein